LALRAPRHNAQAAGKAWRVLSPLSSAHTGTPALSTRYALQGVRIALRWLMCR